VLLLSTAADYALSFYLTDKVPQRSRRLALTVENEFLIGRFSYVDEVLKVVGR
jgi:hypothetical protein